jgi:hypothetical protein
VERDTIYNDTLMVVREDSLSLRILTEVFAYDDAASDSMNAKFTMLFSGYPGNRWAKFEKSSPININVYDYRYGGHTANSTHTYKGYKID